MLAIVKAELLPLSQFTELHYGKPPSYLDTCDLRIAFSEALPCPLNPVFLPFAISIKKEGCPLR